MSHTGQIERLTSSLVHTLSGPHQKPSLLEKHERAALKTLKHVRPGRVNQFEVFDRLEGIAERCLIKHSPEVADALEERRVKLSRRDEGWIPEILHLLLELSDRPAEKTRIEDLVAPTPDEEVKQLTWKKLVKEDPLYNWDGIWDNIDYAEESSASLSSEDEYSRSSSRASAQSPINGSVTKRDGDDFGDLIVKVNVNDLKPFKEAQAWRYTIPHRGSEVLLTEQQMLRECFAMLDGLPTSVFHIDEAHQIVPKVGYRLSSVSYDSLYSILNGLAEIGNTLRYLQRWAATRVSCAVMERSQWTVKSYLTSTNRWLTDETSKIIDASGVAPTLMSFYDHAQRRSKLEIRMTGILQSINGLDDMQKPLKLLDALYFKVCEDQAIGDGIYTITHWDFLYILGSYLRTLEAWMETGEVPSQTPFLAERRKDCNMSDIWHTRYVLTNDPRVGDVVPVFLRDLIPKIFNCGKSVAFLKQLSSDFTRGRNPIPWSKGFATGVMRSVWEARFMYGDLQPFAEILAEELNGLVDYAHREVAKPLHDHLEKQCGLYKTLDSFEYIYLRRDGSLSDVFAREVFSLATTDVSTARASLQLTEALRDVYHDTLSMDQPVFSVRMLPSSLESVNNHWISPNDLLSRLRIAYILPWPIANIVRPSTLTIYQKIHTLLLQITRSKMALENPSLQNHRNRRKKGSPATLISLTLRHHLLFFCNTLLTYICGSVLHPSTQAMRRNLSAAADIDEMIHVHQTYIDGLEKNCFLTAKYQQIAKAFGAILGLSVDFSNAVERAPLHGKHQPDQQQQQQHLRDLEKMLGRYRKLFTFGVAALRNMNTNNLKGSTPVEEGDQHSHEVLLEMLTTRG